jgi:hypothetical protein
MQTAIAPTPKLNGSVQKNQPLKEPIIRDNPVFMVYVTKNYDQFIVMDDNRSVNLLHVKRLVESFNEKHLVCPLIVNERFEIIDGQHRLRASRETGMPVYYIVVPGYGIKEVQRLNANQKNWTKIDFLEMYSTQGKKAYVDFKEFMEHFPELTFQACERIVTGYTSGSGRQATVGGQKMQMRDFQEGKLVIPNLPGSYKNARRVMEFKDYYENFSDGVFVSAILPLFKSKNYDHKEMLYKLSVAPKKLTKCRDIGQYRMLLEDIYNWKRQKENKVSFRYE